MALILNLEDNFLCVYVFRKVVSISNDIKYYVIFHSIKASIISPRLPFFRSSPPSLPPILIFLHIRFLQHPAYKQNTLNP